MKNRLQLIHHNDIFQTREAAINYIKSLQVNERASLFAEPMVLRYESGDVEKGPNIILAIGSKGVGEYPVGQDRITSNKTFFIDITSEQEKIAELVDDLAAAVRSLTCIPLESDTLTAYANKTSGGTYVSGDVRVAESKIISGVEKTNTIQVLQNKGLFHYVDLTYTQNGTLKFQVNDTVKEYGIPVVVSGEYITTGADAEKIVLTMNDGSTVKIPLSALITEWEVSNVGHNVILNRERSVSGTDVVYGDVRIASQNIAPNNIIETKGDNKGLYVRGEADNIKFGQSDVDTELKRLDGEAVRIEGKLDGEISLSTERYNTLSNKIGSGFTTDPHENVTAKFNELSSTVQQGLSDLSAETQARISADSALTNSINAEINRATAAEQALNVRVTNNRTDIDTVSGIAINRLSAISRSDSSINIDTTNPVNPQIGVNINSEANNIIVNRNGLYATVDVDYNALSNTLTFTSTNGTKSFGLLSTQIVNRIWYDSTNEAIVIEYYVGGQIETLSIPVGSIITEWETVNEGHTVVINRIRSTSGTDEVSADVRIASDADNILTIEDGGYLKVSNSGITATSASIQSEVDRATRAESALNASIIAVDSRVDEVSGNVATISGKVDTNISNIDTISGDVITNTNKITSISGKVETNITNIATISGDVITISDKVDEISGNVVTISGDVATVSGKVDTNITNITAISGDVQTNATNIESISGKVSTNITNITSISGDVATVSGKVETNTVNIETISGDVQTNATNIESISGKVDTNITNIESISGDVVTISGKVEANTANITTISGDVATVSGNVVNVYDRLNVSDVSDINSHSILLTKTVDGQNIKLRGDVRVLPDHEGFENQLKVDANTGALYVIGGGGGQTIVLNPNNNGLFMIDDSIGLKLVSPSSASDDNNVAFQITDNDGVKDVKANIEIFECGDY